MTDHKFTEEQIIEVLEIRMPHDAVCREAYDLIYRQKAEIARLITSNSQLEARVCEDRTAIERLQAVHADMTESLRLAAEANKDMQAQIEMLEKHMVFEIESAYDRGAKATIKEFSERLRKIARSLHPCSDELRIFESDIDDLVKEMMEGKNENLA